MVIKGIYCRIGPCGGETFMLLLPSREGLDVAMTSKIFTDWQAQPL